MGLIKITEDEYISFGFLVKTHRKKAGLSQKKLGDQIGLSRETIANIEAGRQRTMLHHASRISAILGFSIERLSEFRRKEVLARRKKIEKIQMLVKKKREELLALDDQLAKEF